MADQDTPPAPDFTRGYALRDLPDGGMVSGRVDADEAIPSTRRRALRDWCALHALSRPSGGRLGRRRYASMSPGTTPASACEPARRCARRLSTRLPAGASSAWARRFRPGEAAAGPRIPRSRVRGRTPDSVVIVGGGGAGLAAADMLRREGYERIARDLSADDSPPSDRPNLSKDFLAGTAQEDWIPLRAPEFYAERQIELRSIHASSALDVEQKRVQLESGRTSDSTRC